MEREAKELQPRWVSKEGANQSECLQETAEWGDIQG